MPDFRHRLKPAQRRQYDRSNAVASIPVRVGARLRRAVELLPDALKAADRRRVQLLGQVICDELCRGLHVAPPRLTVLNVRPSDASGELHGLYVPSDRRGPDRIRVWMITAKRGQVVAFKTFLRTLLHELCHHLDYDLLHLRDSFHTDGFFQRESSLVKQLLGPSLKKLPGSERRR